MSFLNDIDKDLDKLDESFGRLGRSLGETATGFGTLNKATQVFFSKEGEKVAAGLADKVGLLGKNADVATAKLTGLNKSLIGLGAAGFGIFSLVSAFSDISLKVSALTTVIQKGRSSLIEFNQVADSLDFSNAITGSDELARNFEILESTSNKFFDSAAQGFNVLFNNQAYQSWANEAVAAYASVEEAAFRLATITVQGNERSIDAIGGLVENLRELQKETNFAVDSVKLLDTQYQISSSGFVAPEASAQVGKAAIDLSRVGFGDQIASTDVLVKSLRALGDGYEDADKRAAQIFETTKIGITTVDELSTELGPLASQAKNLGVDFAEVTAALAQLTTQGLSTGEATTALSRFLEEVAANSSQAKEALAGFSDEQGRAVQLGAGALSDKGIAGVIEQLQAATKGQLPALQKIFSSVESQNAASLLIGSGTDNLRQSTSQIANVDESKLSQESADIGQTLIGSFEQAKNQSKAAIEDIGAALSDSVLERLSDTETVLGRLTTGGAQFTGAFAAGLDTVKDKVGAVAGFLTTAFVSIGTIVVFEKLFSLLPKAIAGIQSLFAKFTAGKAETESFWQFLQRRAAETFQKIQAQAFRAAQAMADAFKQYVREVIIEINRIPTEMEKAAQRARQLQGGSVTPQRALPAASSPITAPARSNLPSSITKGAIDVTAVDVLPSSIVKQTATNATKISGSVGIVGKSLAGLRGVAGGAISFLSSTLIGTITSMASFAAAGLAIAAAFKVVTGAVSFLAGQIDSNANPAIKEMRASLDSLRGVGDIDKFLRVSDEGIASFKTTDRLVDNLGTGISRLSGAFNVLTFQYASYRQFVEEANKAQNILNQNLEETKSALGQNRFVGRTEESKQAQQRLDSGLGLTAEDTAALEAETAQDRELALKRVEIQEQKIAELKAKGGANKDDVLKGAEQELAVLKREAEAIDTALEARLNAAKAASALSELKNFDTSVPLGVQLNQQSKRQVESEIAVFSETLSKVFSSDNIDPTLFNRLLPELESTLGSISIQVKADPQAALESLEKLRQLPNFETLLFSDVNIRNSFNEAFAAATDAALESAQQIEAIYSSAFNEIKRLSPNNFTIVSTANEQVLSSINSQVETINKELNSGTLTYQRQLELLAQVEELEARRIGLNVESQIAKELGTAKNLQTVEEAILAAEQAKVNLLSQEQQFAVGTVSAAQARLSAAKQELELRKQQLETANREQEIQKENAVKALEDRLQRQLEVKVTTSSTDSASGVDNTAVSLQEQEKSAIDEVYNLQSTRIDETYKRQQQLIEETYKLQKEAIGIFDEEEYVNENVGKFDADQRQTIASSLDLILDKASPAFAQRNAALIGQAAGTENVFQRALLTGDDTRSASRFEESLFDENGKAKDIGALEELVREIESTNAGFLGQFKKTEQGQAAIQALIDTIANQRASVEEEAASKKEQNDRENTANERTRATNSAAAIDSANRQKAALQQKKEEADRTQRALEEARRDAELSKALNDAKVSLQLFSNVVAVARAQLDADFAARESVIKQNEQLADSLNNLASSSIFSNSAVGSQLQAQAASINNPVDRVSLDIEKAISGVNLELQLLQQSLTEARSNLVKAERAGASEEELKPLREAVRDGEKEVATRQATKDTDIGFLLINGAIQRTTAIITQAQTVLEAELRSREALIQQNASLGDAFSKLASTASGIFQNSAFGASLNRIATQIANPVAQAQSQGTRESAEAELRVSALETLFNEASIALEEGIKRGLSQDAIDALSSNRNIAADNLAKGKEQLGPEQEAINRRTAVNTLEAELKTFASEMEEVTSIMSQHAEIIKETIELEQERNRSAKENNDSISALEKSLVGLFGDNPATRQLSQRIEFNQLEDERKFQQSEAVTEAKNQIIDLTLLEAQLALEQEAFANQLTQTDLLSGILAATIGDEEKAKETQERNKEEVDNLSKVKEDSQAITDQRRNLVEERINQVVTELPNTLANIDRNITAQQLDLLGQDPLNPDLLGRTINRTTNLLESSDRRQIDVPSLNDPNFVDAVNGIREVSRSLVDTVSRVQESVDNTRTSQMSSAPTISAPISISLTVQSDSADSGQLATDVKGQVDVAVRQGFDKLSASLANFTA